MTPIEFQNWRKNNPELQKHIVPTEGKTWGRLVCHWHEKTETDIVIEHIFCPCIDLRNGDIYLDCSKKKIYAKHCGIAELRLLQGIFKTAYHLLFPISIPCEIYNTIKKVNKLNALKADDQKITKWQTTKLCLKNSAKSLADIIRTPSYCTAMAIVSIAAVIIGPFSPTKLYDLRKLSSDLETRLFWGDKRRARKESIAPCFQPISSIKHLEEYWSRKENQDTDYSENHSDLEEGMNNITRDYVDFLRENQNHPNCYLPRIPKDGPYISASYGDVEKWKEKHTFVDIPVLHVKSPIEGVDIPILPRYPRMKEGITNFMDLHLSPDPIPGLFQSPVMITATG